MAPYKIFPSVPSGQSPQLKDVAEYIKNGNAKNIVVMAGAGISTSAGIPDFRTPGTGLYSNLQKYNLPYPEAIFSIDYLHERPEAFFTLAKELYPGKFEPTWSHFFFKLLQTKGLLKSVQTQNIDTLEQLAGVPSHQVIEAHGSFATSHCLNCRRSYGLEDVRERIERGEVPRCEREGCVGVEEAVIKPDIVFFGEQLPSKFHQRMSDLEEADLLIVCGTSLQVHPFASLVDRVRPDCPRLLINLESVGDHSDDSEDLSSAPSIAALLARMGLSSNDSGFEFSGKSRGGKEYSRDVRWLGKCDEGFLEFARLLGWEDGLRELRMEWLEMRRTGKMGGLSGLGGREVSMKGGPTEQEREVIERRKREEREKEEEKAKEDQKKEKKTESDSRPFESTPIDTTAEPEEKPKEGALDIPKPAQEEAKKIALEVGEKVAESDDKARQGERKDRDLNPDGDLEDESKAVGDELAQVKLTSEAEKKDGAKI